MDSLQIESFAKPWWRSRTVWGAIIAMIAGVAALFGKTIAPDVQAQAADLAAQAADLLAVAGPIGGGALALYGRFRASAKLTK